MTVSKKIAVLLLTSNTFFLSGNLFAGPDYTNQEISRSDMSHQDLSGAVFVGSTVSRVDFSHSNLEGATFKNANLSYLDFKNADLSGATFINSDLVRLNMSDSDISNVKFINSKLTRVTMNNTNLTNVEFIDNKMSYVEMKETCLVNAQFTKNNMKRVKLDKSVLIGATFYNNLSNRFSKKNVIYNGVADCSTGVLGQDIEVASITKASSRAIITNSDDITFALNDKNSGKIDLTINFDFDSDRIKSEAQEQIFEISQALKSKKLSKVMIEIEGHTDNDGSNDYNLDLSYRRAISVKRELVKSYGFSTKRFSVEGYGESNPIATNKSEMGKALNRRVTLVNLAVSPKSISLKSKVKKRRSNFSNTYVSIGENLLDVKTKNDGSSKINLGDGFINVETKEDGSSKVRIGNFININ